MIGWRERGARDANYYYHHLAFGIFLYSSSVTAARRNERLRMEAECHDTLHTAFDSGSIILTFMVDRPRFSNCCFPSRDSSFLVAIIIIISVVVVVVVDDDVVFVTF